MHAEKIQTHVNGNEYAHSYRFHPAVNDALIRIFVVIALSVFWWWLSVADWIPIDPWALRFLVVKEINCGDWLARGYMRAHQQCDLFYPLGWGCDRVYHKLGNAPILRYGTGSWVLSGKSGVRHSLSPVIRLGLRNPRKKERKIYTVVCPW